MIRPWRLLGSLCVVPVLFATACTASSEEEASAGPSEDEINYRSTAGQEYELSTSVTFTLSTETQALQGAEKEKAVDLQATTLRTRVTVAISADLDKLWPEADRLKKTSAAVQLRQPTASFRDLKPSDDGTSYTLTIVGEFGGTKDLERRLPLETAEGKTFLPVTTDVGNGPQELQVFVKAIERSRNAYPKYLELFEDGLDIGVHLGGDHNDPPKDIDHARSVYDDLVASGFKSPVAKFEDLKIDSGALTSAIKVKGNTVPVRVKIFHVDMSTPETRQLVIDAYKASMKSADVVIYDGHAGRRLDYSGVVLAYKPARASVTANEFKSIESTAKQQVYLFNGCETYTGYADKVYENPNRNPGNTDIITTVNYSAIQSKANQVIAFIHSFIDPKAGNWIPRSWDGVLSKMNASGERSWVHVYGVHGLDDNPKLSPLADVSKIGQACTTDAQCGAADSKCILGTGSRRVCGVACADSGGCPTGTKCILPRTTDAATATPDDQQCVRQ